MDASIREACKYSLAAEVLQSTGELRFRVSGISMLPTLWPGDLLRIRANPSSQIGPGDVVLFEREGRFFVHRVVRTRAECVVTRGDCMPQDDSPISPAQILGRVMEVRRGEQSFAVPAKVSVSQRCLAWCFCRWDLLSRLGMRWHAAKRGARSVQSAAYPSLPA